jgi:hypothetical protein
MQVTMTDHGGWWIFWAAQDASMDGDGFANTTHLGSAQGLLSIAIPGSRTPLPIAAFCA